SPQRKVAKRAVERICARSATSRTVTPTHSLSNVVQPVTQWNGETTFADGSRRNSSYVKRVGLSTEPSTRRSHSFGSKRGTMPRSSLGHFRTSRCPGGRSLSAAIRTRPLKSLDINRCANVREDFRRTTPRTFETQRETALSGENTRVACPDKGLI